MRVTKKRTLIYAFFKLQFSYYPLVRMCCNKPLNTEIYRLHERCPQVVYNDKNSTFNEPLEKHGSVSISRQNLQELKCLKFLEV